MILRDVNVWVGEVALVDGACMLRFQKMHWSLKKSLFDRRNSRLGQIRTLVDIFGMLRVALSYWLRDLQLRDGLQGQDLNGLVDV